MSKLAIVGGRDFTDYEKFKVLVKEHIATIGPVECIISGGAKGVDTLAERYAKRHHIPMIVLNPEWDKYGKMAGLLRNTDIVKQSTHILALPTAQSRGTWDTIRKARKTKKPLKIIEV